MIGDKFIVILSGAIDHTTLDGSGILFGSGSTGPTVDENGANAYVRYRKAYDALEIFPNLRVTGSAAVTGDITGSTIVGTTITATSISATNITGSNFSGAARFIQGLSGSLTQLTDGSSYLVAGSNVTITSASNGSVTTTTTAQTIQSVQWPPRDMFGSTNGDGVEVGILVTGALAGGTVTGTTMNYTGSNGTTNLTATMSSFPGAAVAGTLIPFELAAGSNGVRSIQSITLSATYGATGGISLVAFRRLSLTSCATVNVGAEAPITDDGIRLWPGTSLHLAQIPSVVTATTVQGHVFIVEK